MGSAAMFGRQLQPLADPIRVFIVDDHPVVRAGLRALLSNEDDLIIVGEAEVVDDAAREIEQLAPQVVVLDIKLKDSDGIELCRRIKERSPGTAVIMLSAFWDDSLILRALQAGAAGYLLKDAERFDLQTNIRAVAQGQSILDPILLGAVVRQFRGKPSDKEPTLTSSEVTLVQLVAQGLTNREVGERLHLSYHTVKEHLSTVMAKLGAKNRAEVVLLATKRGLL